MLSIILPKEIKSETYIEFRQKVVKTNKLKNWKDLFNPQLWKEVEEKSISKIKENYGYSRFIPKEDADINSIINYRNYIAHETEKTTTVLDINSVERCIQYFDIFLTFLNEKIKGKS